MPDEELAVYYRHAAVYISMSEHEGFCVPLVEAMAADVPVLAYAAAAVPDTLGGAGVQFAPKDLEYAAELLGALAFDDDLRAAVIAGQRRRLADFGDARISARARPSLSVPAHSSMKIAFVIQRYGAEVLGGSEHLCRLVAERLAAQHDVDVLTTCARDYVTWKNEYPGGHRPRPRRHRAAVRQARTRDIDAFNHYSDWIYNNPHSRADEMEWLKQQGPWCPALIDYLRRHHQQYDVLIFFTYLYAPTVLGLEVAPARSILVSTAHDEPAIRLEIFKDVFSRPAALCYLTESERAVRPAAVSRSAAARGSGRRRRRHSAAAAAIRACRRRPKTSDAGDDSPRSARRRRATTRTPAPRIPVAPACARRRVPPAPSPARTDRALRRPHRSRQGLRGADRVLQRAT